MRVLAVDWGEKRIGLAATDESGRLAFGKGCLARTSDRQAVAALTALATESGAKRVLIGLPLNMDGSEGERAKRARRIAGQLRRALSGAEVVLRDERLTSEDARQRLLSEGLPPARVAERIDETAALILLEDYLAEIGRGERG